MNTRRLWRVMVLVLVCLSVPVLCKSQIDVSTNILQRVFLIKYGNSGGASFTVDVQKRQYLITAKHVVAGIKKGDVIEIFHENRWKPVKITPIYVEPSEVDIIILVLPFQISPSHPLELGSDGLFLSQRVYFLGFPFGSGFDARTANNGYPLPLVKHGICAGFYFSPDNKYSQVLVDGINNPGFSGGPLVFVNQATKKLTVAAVVSSYRLQDDIVFRKPMPQTQQRRKKNTKAQGKTLIETDMIVRSNAGILKSYSINIALDVIAKNSIGAVITQ